MIAGIELPTAIDVSSVVGLIAVGLFTDRERDLDAPEEISLHPVGAG